MGPLWWLPDDAAGAVPNSRACPSLRASQPPRHWRLERVLNEFFLTGSCSTSLGFRGRETAGRSTSPPSGDTSPCNETPGGERQATTEEKTSAADSLKDRNDLGRLVYSRANKQSTRPCRHVIDASWLLSSCLTSASSRSVRNPAAPGHTTEVP